MLTVICITILACWITDKNINPLLEQVKNVNWRKEMSTLMDKLRPYALKTGRVTARPLLQFYYVMADDKTTSLERALIYGAIIYTLSPVSIIPSAVYKLLGTLDEGAAILYVYKKIKNKITPEINIKVENTLNKWFGAEYELIEE